LRTAVAKHDWLAERRQQAHDGLAAALTRALSSPRMGHRLIEAIDRAHMEGDLDDDAVEAILHHLDEVVA